MSFPRCIAALSAMADLHRMSAKTVLQKVEGLNKDQRS